MFKFLNKIGFFYLILVLVFMSGCLKEDKKIEDMSFDELKVKTLTSIEKKDKDSAIEYLEKMVAQYAEQPDIADYKIQLADLYLDTGNLPSAYQMYDHFKEFYPSDSRAEYANYKAILSKFYQTLKTACDQSSTDDTIKLCGDYLKNNNFNNYKNDINDIYKTCERKLIDKEIYVYNFYIKKGELQAAQKRLNYLKDTYLAKNPMLGDRFTYLEMQLAQKQKNKVLADQKYTTLITKFPESKYTKLAQKESNRKLPFLF